MCEKVTFKSCGLREKMTSKSRDSKEKVTSMSCSSGENLTSKSCGMWKKDMWSMGKKISKIYLFLSIYWANI